LSNERRGNPFVMACAKLYGSPSLPRKTSSFSLLFVFFFKGAQEGYAVSLRWKVTKDQVIRKTLPHGAFAANPSKLGLEIVAPPYALVPCALAFGRPSTFGFCLGDAKYCVSTFGVLSSANIFYALPLHWPALFCRIWAEADLMTGFSFFKFFSNSSSLIIR